MTLCEEDCKLTGYNYTTKKAKCSCLVKIDFPLINEIKFDKEKLFNNFVNIKNNMNIKIMKYYKNAFNIKSLLKNYSFYIFILIYVIFFIFFFLFYCKYFFSLKNEIDKISEIKEIVLKNDINTDKIEVTSIKNVDTINIKKSKKKKKGKNIDTKIDTNNKKINTMIKPKRNKHSKVVFPVNPPLKKKHNINKKGLNKKVTDISSIHNINTNKNNNSSIFNENTSIEPADKKLLEFNDNELNSLLYEKALIYDKRTFIQYYISLLKNKHLFIFSFYSNNNDHNSQIIKIFLFIFFFAVHFTVNALFFNDKTMHKIFIDEGEYNFIYQIPQIIYSTIISAIINLIMKYLALSEKIILEIKNAKSNEELELKTKENLKILEIKFVLFFVLTFILLFLFMFYMICFCGIYENTQIHLIKDSVIGFGVSMIYPFGIYLIPGIFRIPALRAQKKDKEYMYKFSKITQSI